MSIMEEVKKVDEELNAEWKRREEAEEKKKREEEKREEEKREEERVAALKLKEEKLRSVIENEDETLDEPHVYVFKYSHYGRKEYFTGWAEHPHLHPAIEPGTIECKLIMTERELLVMKILDNFYKYSELVQHIIGDLEIKEETGAKTKEEELKLESIRRKVEVIKSASEEDRKKKARCRIGMADDAYIEIDDEHAALCSMNVNKGEFDLSDKIEAEKEEVRRTAEEKARREAEEKAQREAQEKEQALVEYKKEHPVKYTFAMIKDAIKNRSRGRE